MQSYRKRTRILLYSDLKHNPQFTYEDVGKERKDIVESDCINPSIFKDDLTHYLKYYKIKVTDSSIFHLAQIFEKFNRFEILRDALDSKWKTANQYILFLNINYYFGERKFASSLFKEVQTLYNITYKDTKEFFESIYKLPFVKVEKGNYKTKKSSIVSYVGFENDPFFYDKSINLTRRVSILTMFMHIQENRINTLYDRQYKNHITVKEKDKIIVDSDSRFVNSKVQLKKFNKKLRKNMSKLAYNFFAYERIFNIDGIKIKGGRMYSSFTQMSKIMRDRICSICGLVEIDMVSSQMNLLYTSSFRKQPENNFDFYTFFLEKTQLNNKKYKKYLPLLRNFAKLACSCVINAKDYQISYILENYLVDNGLIYSSSKRDEHRKVLSEIKEYYTKYCIDGNVHEDSRYREIRHCSKIERLEKLLNSEIKDLNKKIPQWILLELCYSLPTIISEYFNIANIKEFRSNTQIVESNSMLNLMCNLNEFSLSIHDAFIVSKNSNVEKISNDFYKFIYNESIRFSKNEITFNYESIEKFNLSKSIFKKVSIVKDFFRSYLPLKLYIITDTNLKIGFQTWKINQFCIFMINNYIVKYSIKFQYKRYVQIDKHTYF